MKTLLGTIAILGLGAVAQGIAILMGCSDTMATVIGTNVCIGALMFGGKK